MKTMKKKIITLCLVIAMLSVAVIGGTLAYFTDVDQATNEFTVGKVSIDLYETVGHVDGLKVNPHDKSDKITVTGIETDSLVDIGKDTDEAFKVKYGPAMPGDVLTKVITVENDESEDAYVAIAIKQENYGRAHDEDNNPVGNNFNLLIDDYYEPKFGEKNSPERIAGMQALTDELFSGAGWFDPYYDRNSTDAGVRYYPADANIGADNDGSEDHYTKKYSDATLLGIDYLVSSTPNKGETYNVSGYAPMLGKESYTSLTDGARVWIYYYYIPAGKSVTLDISITVPTCIDEYSINAFDGMILDVQASAIQATGFATAKEAYVELNNTYDLAF